MKYNSNNSPIWRTSQSSRKSIGLLDLPNELLTTIFEFMVQEDLKIILNILSEAPYRNGRLSQIVKDIAYSSIIITNYSKHQFHKLDELKKIIPTYKVDRSILWRLEDLLDDKSIQSFLSINISTTVYYVFGNKDPVQSIHKVMRQFCKYLNENRNETKRITSEINLLLNISPTFDTVEEFKRDFQDLNVTFLNRVIRQSSAFVDLRRLYLNDGIYYPFSSQGLDLSNIIMLDALKELYLNNLSLQSVENLRLPSSISTLDLSCNNIANIDNLIIPHMLKKLDLSHNNITFIRREFFPDALKELNLGNNRLNILTGSIFPENICHLNLSNNFIREISFIIPQELRHLNLRQCPIKYISIEAKTTIANSNIDVDLY